MLWFLMHCGMAWSNELTHPFTTPQHLTFFVMRASEGYSVHVIETCSVCWWVPMVWTVFHNSGWNLMTSGEEFSSRAFKRDLIFLEKECPFLWDHDAKVSPVLCPFSRFQVPPPSMYILPKGKQIWPHHLGLLSLQAWANKPLLKSKLSSLRHCVTATENKGA